MLAAIFILTFAGEPAVVQPSAKELAEKAIAARGGPGKLLKLFRIKEQYTAGKTPKTPGTPRESVLEMPDRWWIGKNERGTEPGKVAVWAWTLVILTDPKSKLEGIPPKVDQGKTLEGIRVSGSVSPPLDMYFGNQDHELSRIDWRNDIYRFREWKESGGIKYPSSCVMSRRNTDEPWFHHEILEVVPLKELPKGLERK